MCSLVMSLCSREVIIITIHLIADLITMAQKEIYIWRA